MTVLPRVQFTCTNPIIVYNIRNGIEDVVKRASGMFSFFLLFLVNRSVRVSQQVRKSCPPTRHTHHRADPFDPSVAPVLIPLPIVPPTLALLSTSPSHTLLLRISHPVAQPPYTTLPLTFLPSYPLVCMYAARSRLLAFRLFSNPTPTIFSRYSLVSRRCRYTRPTVKHRTNQGKNRYC